MRPQPVKIGWQSRMLLLLVGGLLLAWGIYDLRNSSEGGLHAYAAARSIGIGMVLVVAAIALLFRNRKNW